MKAPDSLQRQFWHYTTLDRLGKITSDGFIRRARGLVPKGERRAVWFTNRPTWEPTATKLWLGQDGTCRRTTLDEMRHASGSLVRLAVDEAVARHSWRHHRLVGGIDPRMADALERVAFECDSDPSEWRLSYHDVAVARILSVEGSLDGVTWFPLKQVRDGWVVAFDAVGDGKELDLAS